MYMEKRLYIKKNTKHLTHTPFLTLNTGHLTNQKAFCHNMHYTGNEHRHTAGSTSRSDQQRHKHLQAGYQRQDSLIGQAGHSGGHSCTPRVYAAGKLQKEVWQAASHSCTSELLREWYWTQLSSRQWLCGMSDSCPTDV